MDAIKLFLMTLISAILSYLQPIYAPIIVLTIVFFGDIAAGIAVDLVVNKDRIRIKKILFALLFVALYVSIIANTFIIGDHMGDQDESLKIVKILTYVFAYFYVSNTLRNLCTLFPNNKPLAFLYYWLGLQVVKRLPDLAKYLGLGTKKDTEDEKNQ
jgi:hypothetical protein